MITTWWCHRFESWLANGDPSLVLPAMLVEEIGLKIVDSHIFYYRYRENFMHSESTGELKSLQREQCKNHNVASLSGNLSSIHP
jgi:hypothetical protein